MEDRFLLEWPPPGDRAGSFVRTFFTRVVMLPSPPPKRTIHEVYVDRAWKPPRDTESVRDYARFGEEEPYRGVGTPSVRHLEDAPLQRTFFSPENVQIIQNMLRHQVWERSDRRHIISAQNEQELRIVMEAMFVQYARHLPTHIREQIQELNQRVVDSVVPKILTEVEMYYKYLQDSNQPLTLQERPLYVNPAGTKNLEWGRNPESLRF